MNNTNRQTLVFGSKNEALAYLRSIEGLEQADNGKYFYRSGSYYLAHGEYDRPDYAPRRYRDGWGVHVTYYYYSGTYGAPTSGRIASDSYFTDR